MKASQAKYLGTVEDVYRDEIQVEVSSFLYSVYCISECMNNVKCIQKEAAQHFHSLILQLQLIRMRELRRLKGYRFGMRTVKNYCRNGN